jgi:Family of unknown function (DUF6174)
MTITERILHSAFRAMRPSRVVMALSATVILGCSALSVDRPELDRLRSERKAWDALAIMDYDMVFERNCFCDPESLKPVRIEVRGDQVVSVVRTGTGADVPQSEWVNYPDIDQLFDLLDTWFQQKDTEATATYDADFHFPARVNGSTKGALDSTITYSVTEFRKQ